MKYWISAGLGLMVISGVIAGNLPAMENGKEVVIARDPLAWSLRALLRDSSIAILKEDGQRVKVEIVGWMDKAALMAGMRETENSGQVEIVDWRVEALPRDYRRPQGPFNENISAYFQVWNRSSQELSGMLLEVRFLDGEGHLLYKEEITYETALQAGKTGNLQRFWYAENNEFVANDPFDILRPVVEKGSLRLEFRLKHIYFRGQPVKAAASGSGSLSSP